MYAIASLLDPESDRIVRAIWERFEQHCGLTGVKITPLPHFSWEGAESYQLEAVQEALTRLAATARPFTVHASGLGIFTGPQPVVYIALVKDDRLMEMHCQVWETVRNFAIQTNNYYHPRRWMPHITLALKEIQPEGLGCAVADIAFHKIDLEVMVDHFAVIYQNYGQAGLHCRIPFATSVPTVDEAL